MDCTVNLNTPPSRTYLIVNEVANAATHGIGFVLSITGLVFLVLRAADTGETLRIVSYSVYGTTLILLYLFSTLYHSLTFTRAKTVFRIFDHSGIFLLIAGTYTPLSLLVISGVLGWIIFAVIWALAVLGIVYKSIWIGKHQHISTVFYVLMGWLCLVCISRIYLGLGFSGFALLLAGGVSFTLGAVIYCLKQVKFIHVVWHIFVLAGTILMYFSILNYS
ncbi:MAG: hemolysin III family protein [Deferribacteraceae bacterium]|jgi:hemolysin III|nr:hemolysin III family protein [Deferribacteraceae bacterium]